jgi:hypothetical protein
MRVVHTLFGNFHGVTNFRSAGYEAETKSEIAQILTPYILPAGVVNHGTVGRHLSFYGWGRCFCRRKAAVRDDNPVMIFKHKLLYGSKGTRAEFGAVDATSEIPEEDYTVPLDQACCRREGNDVTIIAWLLMRHYAMQAAETLEAEGVSVEVIDTRSLSPFDYETICTSSIISLCALAWYQSGLKGYIPAISAFDEIEENLRRDDALFVGRLADRGKGYDRLCGDGHIIDADQSEFIGDANLVANGNIHDLAGEVVAEDEQGRRPGALGEPLVKRLLGCGGLPLLDPHRFGAFAGGSLDTVVNTIPCTPDPHDVAMATLEQTPPPKSADLHSVRADEPGRRKCIVRSRRHFHNGKFHLQQSLPEVASDLQRRIDDHTINVPIQHEVKNLLLPFRLKSRGHHQHAVAAGLANVLDTLNDHGHEGTPDRRQDQTDRQAATHYQRLADGVGDVVVLLDNLLDVLARLVADPDFPPAVVIRGFFPLPGIPRFYQGLRTVSIDIARYFHALAFMLARESIEIIIDTIPNMR